MWIVCCTFLELINLWNNCCLAVLFMHVCERRTDRRRESLSLFKNRIFINAGSQCSHSVFSYSSFYIAVSGSGFIQNHDSLESAQFYVCFQAKKNAWTHMNSLNIREHNLVLSTYTYIYTILCGIFNIWSEKVLFSNLFVVS